MHSHIGTAALPLNWNTCTCTSDGRAITVRSRGSLGDFWSPIFGLGLLKSLIFSFWSLIFSLGVLKSPLFRQIGLPKFISRSRTGPIHNTLTDVIVQVSHIIAVPAFS